MRASVRVRFTVFDQMGGVGRGMRQQYEGIPPRPNQGGGASLAFVSYSLQTGHHPLPPKHPESDPDPCPFQRPSPLFFTAAWGGGVGRGGAAQQPSAFRHSPSILMSYHAPWGEGERLLDVSPKGSHRIALNQTPVPVPPPADTTRRFGSGRGGSPIEWMHRGSPIEFFLQSSDTKTSHHIPKLIYIPWNLSCAIPPVSLPLERATLHS